MKKNILNILLATILLLSSSCSKEWLEEKQDIKLVVPTTLSDMDLLLNTGTLGYDARGASEIACDDYEFTPEQLDAFYWSIDRDMIKWKSFEIPQYGISDFDEWDLSYAQIQIANIVLDGLEKIQRNDNNKVQYDRIKGSALYFRAKQFLNLSMTFCKYYNKNTATSDLGIPLKLSSDISEKILRDNLENTYQKIISDLQQAANLLPVTQSNQFAIAKGGAFGLLARAYLYMDNYTSAFNAADSSYKYHSYIENYNTVNATPSRPLNIGTKEMHIISDLRRQVSSFTLGRTDGELFKLYEDNDLRKTLFFRINADGKPNYRGSYRGGQLFTATATDEVLLIKAECAARLGRLDIANAALNLLLEKRYKTGTYQPFSIANQDQLLETVLKERRKELLGRGLRWQDLKRLNKEPKYTKTLVRKIGSEEFRLLPNDARYVFPIPQYVINFNGIIQNQY
ncbi:hypothetical protein ABIE26_000213 [Pedobacter africanus]|uniref:Uncharacterized protein n=1 Tax=Pedobacter africanus TaxID=151894 RepID=A0ACC6KVX3_9SPHI|nr:RagB/SusD family nutrient uptake outer membrane protein [Pedobacter africanus]MDR6783299.1 hypothetical protein [Pedobacter africanus]